jgi:HlyD family secretion protein
MKKLVLVTVLAVAAGSVFWWTSSRETPPEQRYRTQAVDRGDIVQAVSANGTLNPVTLVQIGTQVSGRVRRIHADFNDRVSEGQVLAELDPALLEAEVRQSEANLQNAEASLALARSTLERNRSLFEQKLVSKAELDTAQERVKVAAAQVKVAEAKLERDRTNLRYTVIRSPISGVVVSRSVDVGQTVAASFQTPTLFLIAQDLREMQIDTSVAEADVGNLRIGQTVRFTVDAFSDRTYEGHIKQVRLNPTIQQNVVTYNVVVAAENRDGALMPGMTAHVVIPLAERGGVLRVPNAALSFRPKGRGSSGSDDGAPRDRLASGSIVHVLEGDRLREVRLRLGLTDNSLTEVLEGEVAEGDRVVTRELTPKGQGGGSGVRFRFM